jgi:hypothetical protein
MRELVLKSRRSELFPPLPKRLATRLANVNYVQIRWIDRFRRRAVVCQKIYSGHFVFRASNPLVPVIPTLEMDGVGHKK